MSETSQRSKIFFCHGMISRDCVVRRIYEAEYAEVAFQAGTLIIIREVNNDDVFFFTVKEYTQRSTLFMCTKGDVLEVPLKLWGALLSVEERRRPPLVEDKEVAEDLAKVDVGSTVRVLGNDDRDLCIGKVTYSDSISKLGNGVYFGIRITYPTDDLEQIINENSLLKPEANDFPKGTDIITSVDKLRPFHTREGSERFRIDDKRSRGNEDRNPFSQRKDVSAAKDKSLAKTHTSPRRKANEQNRFDLESQGNPQIKIPLSIGEEVVFLNEDTPEKGTVKWLGYIGGSLQVGIEFDNPIGTEARTIDGEELFPAKNSHAGLIPPEALIKLSDFQGEDANETSFGNNNSTDEVFEPVPGCSWMGDGGAPFQRLDNSPIEKESESSCCSSSSDDCYPKDTSSAYNTQNSSSLTSEAEESSKKEPDLTTQDESNLSNAKATPLEENAEKPLVKIGTPPSKESVAAPARNNGKDVNVAGIDLTSPEIQNAVEVPRIQNLENLSDIQHADNIPDIQNPENLPDIQHVENIPNIQNPEYIPVIENAENIPDIQHAENIPNIQNPENLPDIQHAENIHDMQNPENIPDIQYPENIPNIQNPENIPDIQNPENLPDIQHAENLPDVENPENVLEIQIVEEVPDIGIAEDSPGCEDKGLFPGGSRGDHLCVQQAWENHIPMLSHNEGGLEEQSGKKNQIFEHLPPNELDVGSPVKFLYRGRPSYGIIRWIGTIPEDVDDRLIAGVEMEEADDSFTDGTFRGRRYFHCNQNMALFLPLVQCIRDSQFLEQRMRRTLKVRRQHYGAFNNPVIRGTVPPINRRFDVEAICGKYRGIQGYHNSCYLDTTLFAMFAFTCVFDSILYRPPNETDIPQYLEVQRLLKEEIVNPLRTNLYVGGDRIMKFRVLLAKISNTPSLATEEKDPEEILHLLLSRVLKTKPFLQMDADQGTFHYQLFTDRDHNLTVPNIQRMFEKSFLNSKIKLHKIPPCLILHLPRFGREFRLYDRVFPSRILDITDILFNSPRQCTVCGNSATHECFDCFGDEGVGDGKLENIAFCKHCIETVHNHHDRLKHNFLKIKVPYEFSELGEQCSVPRVYMELFAVLCIETSHYVAFVKCGTGVDAPWCFFDSMADRRGEQNGHNVPEMVPCPDLPYWLSKEGAEACMELSDAELPPLAKRLICDGYICMYQSPEAMMYS